MATSVARGLALAASLGLAGPACHHRASPPAALPARAIEVRIQPNGGSTMAMATGHLFRDPPRFDLQVGPCHGWSTFTADPDSLITLDAGKMRLDGLGSSFELERMAIGYLEPPDAVMRPVELAAGSPITVTTTGGADLPAFSLSTVIPEVPILSATVSTVTPGSALVLHWTPGSGHLIEATLAERAAGHGALFAWCEGADADGSLTIPAEVTKHLIAGPAAAAALTIARESHAEASVGGEPLALEVFNAAAGLTLTVSAAQ